MLQCRKDILELTEHFVHMNSIVNTNGEREIAQEIYRLLSSHSYFHENPDHLTIEETIDDHRTRYNVLAFVKGTKKPSRRTVVLLGHMDTVGVEDFGSFQAEAFQPAAWMDALQDEVIPDSIRDNLNSGEWLFGRGVLDMKSGLASNMYLLQYYADHPHQLAGNLVFVAECDEEDASHGILSAIQTLKTWKHEHDFDYVAAINSDFVSPTYVGDPNRYVYKGTAGKLLPTFFITGTETHAGSPFEGIDPNFLAAELTQQINYNPELTESAQGEVTTPPVSLKQIDLKPAYSAQTALSSIAYYNFFTHARSPKDVLERLKVEAKKAANQAMKTYDSRYKAFCEKTGNTYEAVQEEVRIWSYNEMEDFLIGEYGSTFTDHMRSFKQDLLYDTSLDIRMFSVRVVEEAWKWMPTKEPTMIVFYSSLYSPRVALTGETDDEHILLDALEKAITDVQPQYKHPIVSKPFFPYISDMSFVAMSDNAEEMHAVTENSPAWGSKLYVRYEDVRDLEIPVVNIGPYGMDAHSKLERMEMRYSLEMVPNLTKNVIENVLNRGGQMERE